MSSPLPPVPSPAAGLPQTVAAPVPGPAAGAPVAPASPASSASPSVPVTPPAATAVRWSPEMLQSLRLQAFEQLVAQLARQVQSSPGAPAPQWPASGVSEALGRLLEALLAQVGTQQGQALQLLAAQPGSAALLQALAAGTTAGAAAAGGQAQPSQSPQTAASASAQAGTAPQAASSSPALQAAAQPSAAAVTLAVAAAKAKVVDALLAGSGLAPQAGASAPGGVAGGATQTLPALQSWWVQQGTLLTPQGERGFTLSLQVPQAWAQAQGAAMALAAASASAPGAAPFTAAALPAGAALPLAGAQATEPGLRLPLDASLQSLASGPVAVVVQPRGADALRTSALLLLELQPLRQPGGAMASPAGLVSVASLSPAFAQEVQQMLQQRNDPWLHMAAAQASGALPRERRAFEHQSHFCTTEGCQYEGRAPCAQPFCSEMNRLWDVSRTERSR